MVDMYDVVVRLRPVYPIAVRIPNFFKNANPNFAKYVHLDSARVGRHDGIPFRLPRPDPIVQNMTTLEVAAEQPYIHRLRRLAAATQIEGRSLEFAEAIAPVLWDGPASTAVSCNLLIPSSSPTKPNASLLKLAVTRSAATWR
jgi:hypothetical protein